MYIQVIVYGISMLNNFHYTISISCRDEEWHKLEETRRAEKGVADEEFLLIGYPFPYLWAPNGASTSLTISKSDGDGLFIIIDAADEFITNIPFESTLLCKILQRRFLSLSTILVTSRPGACN